jgi:hypothetical protein
MSNMRYFIFPKKILLDCCDGGFRISGGGGSGGTNIVRSNSSSSLFIIVNDGGGDKSISLTCRVEFICCSYSRCSSAVIGKRDIVTLICPG